MKRLIAISVLMLGSAALAAGDENPIEKSRAAIDAALEQARIHQKRNYANPEPPKGISLDALKSIQGVDPAKLAARYHELNEYKIPQSESLMIFASMSIPMESLKRLGAQAAKAKAPILFRGVPGGLGKGALARWAEQMKPVADTGATVQVDPQAFQRFGIQNVPSFVIATYEEGCNNNQCAASSGAMSGDVSLDYALEKMTSRPDRTGRIAQMYLDRIAAANE